MAFYRRRRFRRRRSVSYRRSYARPYSFKRRLRRYRRRGGISSTRSRTVRLSAQLPVRFTAQAGNEGPYYPIPLVFTPSNFPGFMDYASTYSQFRLLKAQCKVHLALPEDSEANAPLSNQPYTYLRVASRPFLESKNIFTTVSEQGGNPRPVLEALAAIRVTASDIRQSRWQRQYYPSDIKNVIAFKFYPYTLEWSGKPVGQLTPTNSNAFNLTFQKWRSARHWMPMSWVASGVTGEGGADDDVSFFGPYFNRLLSAQGEAAQSLTEYSPVCTVSVWCQFRGQK